MIPITPITPIKLSNPYSVNINYLEFTEVETEKAYLNRDTLNKELDLVEAILYAKHQLTKQSFEASYEGRGSSIVTVQHPETNKVYRIRLYAGYCAASNFNTVNTKEEEYVSIQEWTLFNYSLRKLLGEVHTLYQVEEDIREHEYFKDKQLIWADPRRYELLEKYREFLHYRLTQAEHYILCYKDTNHD